MTTNNSCKLVSPVLYLTGYSIILPIGFIMNSIAIFLFFCVNKLRSPTIVYMKNLALADLLLVSSIPLKIYFYVASPSQTSVQNWICDITGSFLLLNMYGSIFLLTCISFDRYLAVCFPLQSRRFRQKASWICVGVWFLNITSCVVIYNVSANPQTNSSCFYGRPQIVAATGPTIGAIGIGFLIPLGVLVISSTAMLRSMKKSQVVQEGLINKVKVIRMLATNVTIFLLCFLPYHMVLLIYQFTENCILEEAYRITLLTACCNTVLDPFTYYFTTDTIRNVVREEIKAGKRFLELSEQSSEKNRPIISS
ncbi:lysophosphatidic acid receptor 6-like [Bufo gargarizans]|uniref:lysophosphatidic acid receptor 6-like n=1 Tax=Bufo gargarizans TaxID=30331 RepID=UPI001CF5C1D8|nr:lysophosphatidic acid receptor 6-like [Bufo gargarizans]XP_044138814.1 lysophosphatidic acid receptor 6-like [Bufo gargarizans]